MGRPIVINHRKVTFSLPKDVVEMLDARIAMMERSKFVAEAIREKMTQQNHTVSTTDILDTFRNKVNVKPGLSSLELLRKFRYEI